MSPKGQNIYDVKQSRINRVKPENEAVGKKFTHGYLRTTGMSPEGQNIYDVKESKNQELRD